MITKKRLTSLLLMFSFLSLPFQVKGSIPVEVTIPPASRQLEHEVTILPKSRQFEHDLNIPKESRRIEHSFSRSTYTNIALLAANVLGIAMFKDGLTKYIEDSENNKPLKKRRGIIQMIFGVITVLGSFRLLEFEPI